MCKITYQFFLVVILFTSLACHRAQNKPDNNKVASIGNENISVEEIDNNARQELFDELNRIYMIRKTTLELLIKDKVIKKEAQKHNKKVDEFLEQYYKPYLNEKALQKYITDHQLQKGIPQLQRTLRILDINTKEGRNWLIYEYKRYLKEQLTDSLMKAYNIKVFLKPPAPIKVDLYNNLIKHYRGNLSSKIEITEVSDFECDKCREVSPIMKTIYNKYKDRVKFGFTHFAPYVSLCAIASECASRQNKFWEMHDMIFGLKTLPDTLQLFNMAKNLKLDMKQFEADFKNKAIENSINTNFERIKALGLYGTPTFIINGKVVFNSTSQKEIESIIEKELKK